MECETEGDSFNSHFAGLKKLFMCIISLMNMIQQPEQKKEGRNFSLRQKTQDISILGDSREGPLQPPSCGADDFSKGAECLAQEVLQGGKRKKGEN